jgi:hypothetical protein
MVAIATVDPTWNLPQILKAAGAGKDDESNILGDQLSVQGVTQQALDAAVAGYDHEAFLTAAIEQRLVAVLNNHLNAVAAQRRYDDRFTCALRAGFAGPFQSEGQAFAAFMDECNMVGYSMMKRAKAGDIPTPTDAELIAAMPVMVWPPSPIPEGAV